MSKRVFVPLPAHEQVLPYEGIELRVGGKEITVNHLTDHWYGKTEDGPRLTDDDHMKMEEALKQILPFKAQYPRDYKAMPKAKLRRWLNKNLQHRWSFRHHIMFESDLDGTVYKLFFV